MALAVLTSAFAADWALAKCESFTLVFYVMGKALLGELTCILMGLAMDLKQVFKEIIKKKTKKKQET